MEGGQEEGAKGSRPGSEEKPRGVDRATSPPSGGLHFREAAREIAARARRTQCFPKSKALPPPPNALNSRREVESWRRSKPPSFPRFASYPYTAAPSWISPCGCEHAQNGQASWDSPIMRRGPQTVLRNFIPRRAPVLDRIHRPSLRWTTRLSTSRASVEQRRCSSFPCKPR